MSQPEYDADGYPTEDTLVDMEGDQAYDHQQQYGREVEGRIINIARLLNTICFIIGIGLVTVYATGVVNSPITLAIGCFALFGSGFNFGHEKGIT